MQPRTIGPSIEPSAGDALCGRGARFPGRYLNLTSFKRDGTGPGSHRAQPRPGQAPSPEEAAALIGSPTPPGWVRGL